MYLKVPGEGPLQEKLSFESGTVVECDVPPEVLAVSCFPVCFFISSPNLFVQILRLLHCSSEFKYVLERSFARDFFKRILVLFFVFGPLGFLNVPYFCCDVFWHCSSHSAPWGRLAAFVRELYCCCCCCCFLSSVERLLLGMIFLLITFLCSFLLSMMKSLSEEDLFTYRKNLLWSIFLPHLGLGKSLPCTSSQLLATSSIAFPVHLVSNVDRYCARDFSCATFGCYICSFWKFLTVRLP